MIFVLSYGGFNCTVSMYLSHLEIAFSPSFSQHYIYLLTAESNWSFILLWQKIKDKSNYHFQNKGTNS